MFSIRERPPTVAEEDPSEIQVLDIEDIGARQGSKNSSKPILVTSANRRSNDENSCPAPSGSKRKHAEVDDGPQPKCDWRQTLGPAPKLAQVGVQEWLKFQKRKWLLQLEFRQECKINRERAKYGLTTTTSNSSAPIGNISRSITNFVQKSTFSKIQKPWQILRICEQSNSLGLSFYFIF